MAENLLKTLYTLRQIKVKRNLLSHLLMVTRDTAIAEGRYRADASADYHELSEEKMINAITQFQNPILLMESLEDFNEPRIVAVLDEKGNDGLNLIAVLELYANRAAFGSSQERNHVLITIYEKSSLPEYIRLTAEKDRIMHIRKGASLDTEGGLQLAGAISNDTLKKNVAQFNKKVKAFKEKNKITYQRRNAPATDAMLEQVNRKLTSENARLKEDVGHL